MRTWLRYQLLLKIPLLHNLEQLEELTEVWVNVETFKSIIMCLRGNPIPIRQVVCIKETWFENGEEK